MVDLDLDLLVETKKVKLNGKVFDVAPADVRQLVRLTALAERIDGESKDEEALSAFSELLDILNKLVPSLEDESLTIEQAFALIEFINANSLPSDTKELEKQGITTTDKKKDK